MDSAALDPDRVATALLDNYRRDNPAEPAALSPLQAAQIAHSTACERADGAALALQQAQAEMQQAVEAVRKAGARVANLRAVGADAPAEGALP